MLTYARRVVETMVDEGFRSEAIERFIGAGADLYRSGASRPNAGARGSNPAPWPSVDF